MVVIAAEVWSWRTVETSECQNTPLGSCSTIRLKLVYHMHSSKCSRSFTNKHNLLSCRKIPIQVEPTHGLLQVLCTSEVISSWICTVAKTCIHGTLMYMNMVPVSEMVGLL